jgi:hypothetical protein
MNCVPNSYFYMEKICESSSAHCVLIAYVPAPHEQTVCSLFTFQLHTTTASTTRQTPHAVLNSLVLLTMGIMMLDTC